MNLFLAFAFLFYLGSSLGWVLELFYRRWFSAGKWLNPGFLVGPWLPLYGFGLCLLYLLAEIPLTAVPGKILPVVLRVVMIGAAMTLIEYIAGKIFIVGMKIKLWDYSNKPGNIEGIICPEFTLYWTLLGAAYCYAVHPFFMGAVEWLFRNLAFSFVVGMFYGVFLVDFATSVNFLARVRKFAKENDVIVRLEEFKKTISEKAERNRFLRFLSVWHEPGTLPEHLKDYAAQLREKTKDLGKDIKDLGKDIKEKVSRRIADGKDHNDHSEKGEN